MRRRRERGQSLVEVAIFVPIVIVLFLAVGDLARVFAAMISVESAAREAADWGAYRPGNWDTGVPTYPVTVAEMERRACTAAMELEDYQGASDGSTCTNPTFECFFGTGTPTGTCEPPGCDPLTDASGCDSYRVRVRLTYTFNLVSPGELLALPSTLTFDRESVFALGKPPAATP